MPDGVVYLLLGRANIVSCMQIVDYHASITAPNSPSIGCYGQMHTQISMQYTYRASLLAYTMHLTIQTIYVYSLADHFINV